MCRDALEHERAICFMNFYISIENQKIGKKKIIAYTCYASSVTHQLYKESAFFSQLLITVLIFDEHFVLDPYCWNTKKLRILSTVRKKEKKEEQELKVHKEVF